MKKFKYESIFIYNFIFLIVGLFIIISILNKLIPIYIVTKASLVLDNTYSAFIDNKTLKQLNKNPYVYIDSKRIKIEIIDTYKKYYKNYNKVIFKIKKKINNKELDISIYNNKDDFKKIFFKCWEE